MTEYDIIQNRITRKIITKKRINYYFAFRTKKDDIESLWKAYDSPFIITGGTSSHLHGEFITSKWFNKIIPDSLDCAIVKITTDTSDPTSRNMSTIQILNDVVYKMNKGTEFLRTNDVAMIHNINQDYFYDINNILKNKMSRSNDDCVTIHSTMDNEKGFFGISFTMKKEGDIFMYCPNFTLKDA